MGQPVSDNFSTFTTLEYPGVSDDQMFSGVKKTYTEVVLNSVSAQEFGDALMSYRSKRSDQATLEYERFQESLERDFKKNLRCYFAAFLMLC